MATLQSDDLRAAPARGFLQVGPTARVAYNEWWRACGRDRRPFVVLRAHGRASGLATVRYDAETMTDGRWTPRITDEADAEITERVHALVQGSKRGHAAYGGSLGTVSRIGWGEATDFAFWLPRLFARPESFTVHDHPFNLGEGPDPFDLRFDWASSLVDLNDFERPARDRAGGEEERT